MTINLLELVGHRTHVQADDTVGKVFRLFCRHPHDYMAVLDKHKLIGLCAKRDLSLLLGTQYGYALFSNKPIRDYLIAKPISCSTGTPIQEIFEKAFSRDEGSFYDDVILTSHAGKFIGLIFTQTLIKLQNRLHLETIRLLEHQQLELSLKSSQIETDLRMSRELQQALLPETYPRFPPSSERTGAVTFYHRYLPVDLVGGDFFHILQLSDHLAGVFIADVMGHGVRAALIMAMLRALLEQPRRETLNPSKLLAVVNREMTKILAHVENETMYATALYAIIDTASGRVRFASAGHPHPVYLNSQTGCVESLHHPNPGTILGVFEDGEFAEHESNVNPGDWLLFFTDGLIEVESSDNREFGIARLEKTLAKNRRESIQIAIDNVIASARSFAAENRFTDDVCVVGVAVHDLAAA